MAHPKQLARIGLFYIEEAILEVLFEAKQNGNPLVRLVDIQKKLGMHQKWEQDNWLPRSVLYKLCCEKRVRQEKERDPFEITDAEYEKRQ